MWPAQTLDLRPSGRQCAISPMLWVSGSQVHVPHSTFPLFLQQTKERVKLLIQLADGFCEKGHAHAAEIKKCVTAVDKRYRDFSLRMEKYRTSLEKALGISSDSNKSVNCFVHTGQVVISAPCHLAALINWPH